MSRNQFEDSKASHSGVALRPIAFALLMLTGQVAITSIANADGIVADHTAPGNQQPVITNTASGITQVNIQTPSAAGVSRNTYSQFDVSQQGVILNNSRTNVQTQLGGFIQGNPYLNSGTARVILNEVNSSNPSLLNGYIEVAGSRAQVVIANPAGISCDGCGFINANRATLTTGTPIMNSGNLMGYRVGGGTINFLGAGLDTTQANYTDVIARAVQINTGILANSLNVVTGTNQVNIDNSGDLASVTPITPNSGSTAPSFAVDVAALGGMYAGKIHLIGTEAGLGVRNAGDIGASAGEVAITLDGHLTNTGHIVSTGNTNINITGNLDNTSASIGAGGTLDISSSRITNEDGLIQATGSLTIDTHGESLLNTHNNVSGGILSNGAIHLTTGNIDNTSGYIGAAGNVSADSAGITNTSGQFLSQQAMGITSTSLSGDGSLLAQGDMTLAFHGNFNNTGQVIANGMLQFTTDGNLTNSGKLQAADTLEVNAANVTNAVAGELSGFDTHITTTGTVTNRGLIDGSDTLITAATLTNIGTGSIFGDHVALNVGTLNNHAETVSSINNSAVIAARNGMDIGAVNINNTGNSLLFSSGDLAIGGTLDSNHLASGQASQLINEGSTIEALGAINASVTDLQNTNAELTTQTVAVGSTSYDQFIPRGTSVVLNSADYPGAQIGNFNVEYRTAAGYTFREYTRLVYTGTTTETQLVSSLPGKLLSGGDMNLTGAVTNSDSEIMAGGNLTVTGPTLVNLNTSGSTITRYHGTNYYYDYDGDESCSDPGDGCYDISSAPYNPAASVNTFNLPTARVDQNTAPTSTGTTIGSLSVANVAQTVSSNSLFQPTPDPAAGYLIETNPRFANYGTWLSSDYMLSQLSFDGDITLKRLGDGFYEQRLIREQVAQLTGRRFLTGYSSDQAQYQALMNSGITMASSLQLTPGIALSAAQAAQLTSDIVWLVQQEVTLPDGTKTLALVPRVYVAVKPNDLSPTTGMLTGNNVQINLTGDLNNGGTIAGRSLINLTAENVNNLGGNINGAATLITARQDINNIGGTISAQDALVINAARDINLKSTTQSSTNATGASTFSRTNIDRVAGLYVSNPDAILVASADNDINLMAAAIQNSGANGVTQINAGNNLTLGTVQISEQNNSIRNSKNHLKLGSTEDIGTVIQTQGDIALNAGQDITAKAATINSADGNLTAIAGKDINVVAGDSTRSLDFARKTKSSGTFSSTTKVYKQTYDGNEAVSSSLGAKEIVLQAGSANVAGNVNILGSNVVSDNGTTITATSNVNIAAVENTSRELNYKSTKKSGLSASGASVSYGTSKLSTNQTIDRVTNTGSTVGSTGGDVVIQAGKGYTQTGSDVLAPAGDIDITAQKVDIDVARNVSSSVTETKFKQTGITLAITNPVISAIQTANQMKGAASETSDPRMQALAAATTGLAAKNAYDAVNVANQPIKNLDGTTSSPSLANQAGGVNVSLSLGTSKSSSKSVQTNETAQSSQIVAGGDIAIKALGAGKESDINITGSQIKAGDNVIIQADDQINLLAAQDIETLKSTNKSSSASVGASYGTSGLLFNASASGAKGKANGQDVTWKESIVEGGGQSGDKVSLVSGTDLNIVGAQVKGNQVIADVGTSGKGNLNIQSLQDLSSYKDKQQSLGGSISVGAGLAGGSLNYGKSKTDSDYASVNEQAGIFAGNDGFQVHVNGNTNLNGAVLASTEQAILNNKNILTTETLTVSDIKNKADFKATSLNLGGGYSTTGNGVGKDQQGGAQSGGQQVPNTSLPSLGNGISATAPVALSASGKDSSTTLSAISGGVVEISDNNKQVQETGKDASTTIAALNRDVKVNGDGIAVDKDGNSTAATLKPIYDADKRDEINADFEIARAFSNESSTFLANRAKETVKAQKDIENELKKPEGQRNLQLLSQASSVLSENETWAMGGSGRSILTVLNASISGNVTGTNVEFIQAATINYLQSLGAQQIKAIADQIGGEGSPAHTALHALLACGGATAGGGSCGLAAASASSALVINELLDGLQGKNANNLSSTEREARLNLVTTLVTGITALAGGDAVVANTAATIETSNNHLVPRQLAGVEKAITTCGNDPACQMRVRDSARVTSAGQDLSLTKAKAECEIGNCSNYNKITSSLAKVYDPATVISDVRLLHPEWSNEQILSKSVEYYSEAQKSLDASTFRSIVGTLDVVGTLTNFLYPVAGGANAVTKSLEASTGIAAVSTTKAGFLNSSKICATQCELSVVSSTEKSILKTIVTQGDNTGKLTESLVDSVLKREGQKILEGGKYGADNGFDHVVVNAENTVTIIIDSKQITNGSVSLSKGAGGNIQLSEPWVRSVLTNLSETSPAYLAVNSALKSGTLKTMVTGVDKVTQKLVIIPVKVPLN